MAGWPTHEYGTGSRGFQMMFQALMKKEGWGKEKEAEERARIRSLGGAVLGNPQYI